MSWITGCEIFNQNDQKYYMLYTEWYDSYFKIMLLESATKPLTGEMNTKDVNYYSDELSKSSDEYLEETKRIFSGKEKAISFFIKEKTFEWKKNLWILGKIDLSSPSDICIIYQRFQHLLKIYQTMQDKMNAIEEENKILMDTNKELSSKMHKLVEMKSAMESDLYKKFILVLNSKKKKLKELEEKVKGTNKESVYNASTDEGESEEEREIVEKEATLHMKGSKRKSVDKDIKQTPKSKKIIPNEISPKPSTSKESTSTTTTKLNDYEEQSCSFEHRKSRSSLNFFEEVPEEDIFS